MAQDGGVQDGVVLQNIFLGVRTERGFCLLAVEDSIKQHPKHLKGLV